MKFIMPAVSRACIYMALGAALLAVAVNAAAVRMPPRARSPRTTPPEVPEAIRNANETFLDLRNGLGAMRRLTGHPLYIACQLHAQYNDLVEVIASQPIAGASPSNHEEEVVKFLLEQHLQDSYNVLNTFHQDEYPELDFPENGSDYAGFERMCSHMTTVLEFPIADIEQMLHLYFRDVHHQQDILSVSAPSRKDYAWYYSGGEKWMKEKIEQRELKPDVRMFLCRLIQC